MQKQWKTKSNLSLNMIKAGLSPSKEYLSAILIAVVGGGAIFGLYLLDMGYTMLIGAGLLLIALLYVFLTRSKGIIRKNDSILENEFFEVFAYFSVYIRNGVPVYHSLEESRKYCKGKLGPLMDQLIDDIDKDKTLEPYVSFGNNFSSLEIRQLMLSIYRMGENGGSESYIQAFQSLFEAMANEKKRSRLEMEKNKFGNLSLLPLGASGISMLLITIGVVQAIGGELNGI